MSFKERIKKTTEKFVGYGYFFAAYAGVTIAFNVAPLPFQAGLEYVLNQPRRQYVVTMTRSRPELLLGTHGILMCADFETEEGISLSVCDGPSVRDGKLFANTRMGGMQEGETYDVSLRGSDNLGYTLVEIIKEE